MSTISTAQKVVCHSRRCDLTVFTDDAGERAFHWLQADQMDRLPHPTYSDSPVQREALDRDGVAHEAVVPPELMVGHLRRAPLRALLRMLPRCPWVV